MHTRTMCERTHVHRHTCAHTRAIHKRALIHTHSHTHTHTHTRIHPPTRTHTYTHTHLNTHARTHPPRRYVSQVLGPQFTESPSSSLPEVFKDASPATPVIFILSQGADPMSALARCASARFHFGWGGAFPVPCAGRHFSAAFLSQGADPMRALVRRAWACMCACVCVCV